MIPSCRTDVHSFTSTSSICHSTTVFPQRLRRSVLFCFCPPYPSISTSSAFVRVSFISCRRFVLFSIHPSLSSSVCLSVCLALFVATHWILSQDVITFCNSSLGDVNINYDEALLSSVASSSFIYPVSLILFVGVSHHQPTPLDFIHAVDRRYTNIL